MSKGCYLYIYLTGVFNLDIIIKIKKEDYDEEG